MKTNENGDVSYHRIDARGAQLTVTLLPFGETAEVLSRRYFIRAEAFMLLAAKNKINLQPAILR